MRQKAASQTNQPKLALLAIPAQPDVFTKVKAEIDKMVAELQTQQKDEIEHRDNCIGSFDNNKRETTAAYDKKESLETKMVDLEGQDSLRFHSLCNKKLCVCGIV